jgi:hypothetical protein
MIDKATSPPSPHSSLFTTEEGQKDLEALVNKRSDLDALAAKRHQIEATAELEMDCSILITFILAVVAIFVSIIIAVSSVSNPVNQPGNETGQVLLLLLTVL